MEEGETKTISIPADDAYGPKQQDLILTVPRSKLPEGLTPSVGQRLQMSKSDGGTVEVVVNDINDETVIIDANHPLAGKTLVFDVHLVEIA